MSLSRTRTPQRCSEGQQLAMFGADAAAHAADRAHGNWRARAWDALIRFGTDPKKRGKPFMAEDVRLAAEADGLPPPPDRRAWGHIIRKAAQGRLIYRVGFQGVKDPKSHNGPKSVWVWVG